MLCKEPSLRLGSSTADANELKNHPFFAKVNWKKLEAKKIDPPLKPHLDPIKEAGLDPWAAVDNEEAHFEMLSNSEQEVLQGETKKERDREGESSGES